MLIRKLTQENAMEIADHWKYEGDYAFYDMTADEEDYAEFTNEKLRNRNDHFEVYDKNNFIGFFSIVQEEGNIEIGLGLHPAHCGHGLGQKFIEEIEEFIKKNYSYHKLIMNVALFNQRALKVYFNCGFQDVKIENRNIDGKTYEFLKLEKHSVK